MSGGQRRLIPHEHGLQPSQVVDAATSLMAQRSPLWDDPVAFVLSSLEKTGTPVAERCFELGETTYVRGDQDRHLCFVTKGVVKLYKSYGGYKEAIVTSLEVGNIFGEPAPRSGGAHHDSAEAASACRVVVLSKAALEHQVQRDPRCALELLVAYAQWVQRVTNGR